jgi:hypothetical protein
MEQGETRPVDLEFLNLKRIHLIQKFKYLGSSITNLFKEDAETEEIDSETDLRPTCTTL